MNEYQRSLYTAAKYLSWATISSLTLRVYLHSFSRCWLPKSRKRAKFCQNLILQRSRSSKVIDLGVNRKPICDFLLVANINFRLSPTFFEILTLKARKWLIFPTPLLF